MNRARWFCPTCGRKITYGPGLHTCDCGAKSSIQRNGDAGHNIIPMSGGTREPRFVLQDGKLKEKDQ